MAHPAAYTAKPISLSLLILSLKVGLLLGYWLLGIGAYGLVLRYIGIGIQGLGIRV